MYEVVARGPVHSAQITNQSRPSGLVSSVASGVLLWTFLACPPASCYPGGAPVMACGDMFPSGHGTEAQVSPSPYRITVPKRKYDPNTTIKISLIATVGYFRGVFVQARRVGCRVNVTEVIGSFTINDNELEAQHCFGKIHSAVTHKMPSKKTRKDIYWTPPVTPAGHVVIRATFVMEKEMFWIGVESDILVDLQEMDTPKCIASTVRPIPAFTTTPPTTPFVNYADDNVLGKYSSGAVGVHTNVAILGLLLLVQALSRLTHSL
ncbi:putative defense protein Hdd11 [Haliotis cracherodii]|uniref:putative defense protein Hdd11 n=1 Tax=Haliotis cracherodii TaxID=6455 RepID=UPI0039ECBAE0